MVSFLKTNRQKSVSQMGNLFYMGKAPGLLNNTKRQMGDRSINGKYSQANT